MYKYAYDISNNFSHDLHPNKCKKEGNDCAICFYKIYVHSLTKHTYGETITCVCKTYFLQ